MIVFIILNYNGEFDTIKCVDSIMNNMQTEKFKIIIVDNGSTDCSGEKLNSIYYDQEYVEVILSDKNLGFSKGNNLGCSYAINKFDPDVLCVFNNDTYIDDNLFENKIRDLYKGGFDILAPKIWNVRGSYNQNPFNAIYSLDGVSEAIKKNTIQQILLKFKLYPLYYLYAKNSKYKFRHNSAHGAALIFSRHYYERFKEVFPEFTFMYGEENLLEYRKNKFKLKLIFDFSLTVFHSDSNSTKKATKNKVNKWKFQTEKIGESLNVLKQIYELNCEI